MTRCPGSCLRPALLSASSLSMLLFMIGAPASAQITFERTYGDDAWEEAYDVVETDDGGYIVAGATSSYGAGSHDMYVVRLDAHGDTLWTRTQGGTASETAAGLATTGDGGLILAGTAALAPASGAYLVRVDSLGQPLWARSYAGSANVVARSVTATADGGYIVAGSTDGGPGGIDVYLLRTDANGDVLWERTHGGSDWDMAYAVEETQDGGLIVAGYTRSQAAGGYDFYVLKTDADGLAGTTSIIRPAAPAMPAAAGILAWPSPFNPITRIRISIPTAARVRLTVHSAAGRRLATIRDHEYQAGVHELTWNAAGLASGVYTLHLQAGRERATTRVILVK